MIVRKLVGLVINSRIPDAADLVSALVDSLHLQGTCWTSSVAKVGDVRDRLESTSLVVTAGGDGTILQTLRVIAPFEIPIVGVNMGRIGFMTELQVEEAAERLPMYLSGDLRVEERMMLQASVTSGSEGEPPLVLHGLNDMVLGQSGVAQLLDIDAVVDGAALTSYRADAVIVSTATGSTAYALSAGGPIMYPEARLVLVQPVAAHTGLREGLILPEDSVIELSAGDGRQAMLSVDGFQDARLDPDDKVSISRSPYVARFLRANPPSSFYTSLVRRLGQVHRWRPPEAEA